MKKKFIEELRWRGMVHDTTPGLDEQLEKELTTAYIGFDPTAASLHIGNLLPIMMLKHFQLCGHQPIVLVGGATGMIGDPSGKNAERKLLSEEILRENEKAIQKQLEKFLDFELKDNPALVVNNYDWFKDFGFLNFLRDVGKYMQISYMMAKDSVKNRLEKGISFTEFSYQLLQAYDFYWLNQSKNCKLQMGASDQWGNITSGTELIGKKSDGKAYALVCPLLTRPDGSKFGKSEGKNVWLDPTLTSPYSFYQFWLKIPDTEIIKYLKIFTLFAKEEIEDLGKQHLQTNPNELKRILAKDLTERVHSYQDFEMAFKASNLLYGKSILDDFENTDESVLKEVFDGVPQKKYSQTEWESFENILDLFADSMTLSKSEVRRQLKNNALNLNKERLTETNLPLKDQIKFLKNKFLLLQKGKQYHLVEILS